MTRSAPFLVLGIGVAIVSTASILIRYAQADGASSAMIAAGRLTIAALIIAPFALSRAGPELLRIRRKDLFLCAVSGLLLAVHFWTWIASLEYTSVANSTVLVHVGTMTFEPYAGHIYIDARAGAGFDPTIVNRALGTAARTAGSTCFANQVTPSTFA